MTLLLFVLGLGLLVLPGVTAAPSRVLAPPIRARAAQASLGLGLGTVAFALGTRASPALFHAAGWHAMANACAKTFGTVLPGSPVVGWLAGGTVLVLGARLGFEWRRAQRSARAAYVEAGLGLHFDAPDSEVVILPAAGPLAYSVERPSAQIVISAGLIERLSDAQLTRVLRHERSHLRHRHQRALMLLASIDATLGWMPGVRTSTAVVRVAFERWADEDASGTAPASRECLRAALLATAGVTPFAATVGFHAVDALAERVAALAEPAPSGNGGRRLLAWVLPTAVISIGLVTLGRCLGAADAAATAAACCPR